MHQEDPEIVRIGIFDMQVCVPANWTDEQIEQFANAEEPELTWTMLPADSKYLAGDPQRNPCAERKNYVHVRLEC